MKLATLAGLALFTSVAHADAPKCPTAAARVVAHGEWLAISGGAKCFAPDKDGKPDPDVLGAGLSALAAAIPTDCGRAIEIAGDSDVSYQNLIATMDLAIKAGLPDVGLTDASGLSIKIDDSAALEKSARRCAPPPKPAPAPAPAPASPPSPGAVPPAPPAPSVRADVPIVILSTTTLTLDGATLGDVATLAKGKGVIPALVKALRAHKTSDPHTMILQADQASNTAVVNRVVASGKQAGYDNVLFAVRNK